MKMGWGGVVLARSVRVVDGSYTASRILDLGG